VLRPRGTYLDFLHSTAKSGLCGVRRYAKWLAGAEHFSGFRRGDAPHNREAERVAPSRSGETARVRSARPDGLVLAVVSLDQGRVDRGRDGGIRAQSPRRERRGSATPAARVRPTARTGPPQHTKAPFSRSTTTRAASHRRRHRYGTGVDHTAGKNIEPLKSSARSMVPAIAGITRTEEIKNDEIQAQDTAKRR
jgi:hypothetical protein